MLIHLVWAAVTGTFSMAERSYPSLRSESEARRTPSLRGGGQEELPHVRGQGQWPRVPGTGMVERSYPLSEARGSGREEQPHMRGQGR